ELARANQVGILAGQAQRLAAMLVDQVDDILVHLAAENHFHHIHGRAVGHAHAFDELAGDVQALEQVTDLRTTAMHHYRIDANVLHHHDILVEAVLHLFALHSVAAGLDDDGLAGDALDIGQSLGQEHGYLGSGVTVQHGG